MLGVASLLNYVINWAASVWENFGKQKDHPVPVRGSSRGGFSLGGYWTPRIPFFKLLVVPWLPLGSGEDEMTPMMSLEQSLPNSKKQ